MIEKVTLQMNAGHELVLAHGNCSDLNPKALMLYSAAMCAGLTVLHIMRKEKLTPRRFEISVAGELSTPTVEAISVFNSFRVTYNVECGLFEEQAKASHAVTMAHEKYCGLLQMLRKIAPVSHEIAIASTEPAKA